MSPSRSIVHKLSPSIEAAMADMLEIIEPSLTTIDVPRHYIGMTVAWLVKRFSTAGYL